MGAEQAANTAGWGSDHEHGPGGDGRGPVLRCDSVRRRVGAGERADQGSGGRGSGIRLTGSAGFRAGLAMNRIRQEIADLHPSYAALVMATGIVSTGLAHFGWDVLSDVLLVVAVVAFAVLLVAYAWRLIAYPRRALADAWDPGRGFGYFSLVAAPNVLGVRLALDHHLGASAVLALASVPIWLVLTYAIPGVLIVGHRRESVLPRINGSWFMWVVATQSLSVAAATVAVWRPGLEVWLAPVAVALWGIGVVLYLMLTSLVTARLLDDPVTPHALSPAYWVYMGATAITVLAAAKILALPAGLPVLVSTRQVVSGLAYLLWAFGTWWIPLLLIFGVWRHVVRGPLMGYEPTLWSMVFPLGMYAAASDGYGRSTGLWFMVDIARVEVWVGFAAWVAVAIAMGVALLRPSRHEVPGSHGVAE
ncbi:tellurite resistance protein permease [Nonomuraea phyllanthi]|uniref:Tellurite resistance protein permease n=2 Tax=Nonomuraea phyllanthi TaxID=2219224 RepID=A0A5C4VEE1_9ACTN|nr:tellurite resistance protein permease [Nonomuraea phyllanthi]